MDGSPRAIPTTSSLLFRSLRREHGFVPLELEGTIPDRLAGTLHRVGPGLVDSLGVPVTHLFEADGAVTSVRIADGRAEGAIRVVQSRGLRDEQAAGRPLYGPRAPYWQRMLSTLRRRHKNPANTAPMLWQDRLYALVEAFEPTQIDPDTLETIGESDLGVVPFAFSAHPHRVAARRAQYNFGVRYGRITQLDVFALPDEGPARRLTSIPLERPVLMHDFVATETRLVFFVSPLEVRVARAVLQLGPFGDLFRYRPEHGTEVIVVPIDDPTRVRRFTVDAFYQWHFGNAADVEGGVAIDFVRYADADTLHQIGEERPLGSELVRVRLDERAGRVETTATRPGIYEFPTIDPRRAGGTSRVVFTNTETTTTRGIARHDLVAGTTTTYVEGTHTWYGEAVFVPDPAEAREGAGWLLCTVLDARRERSYLGIFDAERLDAGPLAKLWFDEALPVSFHGVFQARASVPS